MPSRTCSFPTGRAFSSEATPMERGGHSRGENASRTLHPANLVRAFNSASAKATRLFEFNTPPGIFRTEGASVPRLVR